jgi:hypothetical protein
MIKDDKDIYRETPAISSYIHTQVLNHYHIDAIFMVAAGGVCQGIIMFMVLCKRFLISFGFGNHKLTYLLLAYVMR